mgnify:CR=1 FL=1
MSQELAQEGTALVQQVTTLQVIDEASFGRAGEMLKTVKVYLRRVAEVFDPIVTSAHTAWKTALEQRKGVEQYAVAAERTLKERMGAYEQDQARLRRQAEEAARREQERLEVEERARVAAEEVRLRAQAEEVRLAEAIVAEQAGDTVRAQALVEAPIVVAPVAPRPIFVAPPPMAQAKVEGVSFRDDWDFEIENAALIPREYLTPDLVRIRGVVKAMKAATNIPGIKVIPKRIASVRA